MLENIIVLVVLLGSVAFVCVVYKIVSYIFDKTWENIEKEFMEKSEMQYELIEKIMKEEKKAESE